MSNHNNCAVALCNSHGKKTAGHNICYHRFPKDPHIRKIWLARCQRKDLNFNPDNAHICSLHFLPEDYKRDLEHELLGKPIRRRLNQEAMPSVNINPKSVITSASKSSVTQPETQDIGDNTPESNMYANETNRLKRCKARSDKNELEEVLKNSSPLKKCHEKSICTQFESQEEQQTKRYKQMEAEIETLKSCNQGLNDRVKHLRRRSDRLQLALTREKLKNSASTINVSSAIFQPKHTPTLSCAPKRLNKKSSNWAAKDNAWLQKNSPCVVQKVKQLFTPSQVKSIVKSPQKKGSKTVNWKSDDIALGIALRSQGARSYEYLRAIGFPFPSVTTLQRWTKHFTCKPGIMHEVLDIIAAYTREMSGYDKLCIISFDEMNIDARICYDSTLDKILGPHSNVQVVMVRALTRKWKQPIYFDFDVVMNATLLKDIIKELEKRQIRVIGVVSNMGAKNTTDWNQLGITMQKTFFQNPVFPDKRIWVFHDVPHLLKLLRNHFLDSGIKLIDGTVITETDIQELLDKDCSELKVAFHLTSAHINLSGRGRQHVRTAAQLFSNRTSNALDYVVGKTAMAKFFRIINNGFDVLNSRRPVDDNQLKSAFGLNLFNLQNSALAEMKRAVYHMRVGKNKNMLPFQIGIVMSIESLRGLYRDFVNVYQGHYILTARLNQDCLEKVFSRIRRLGGFHDHPQAVDVRNRIRLLILSSGTTEINLSPKSAVGNDTTHNNVVPPSMDDNDDDFAFLTNELLISIEGEHDVIKTSQTIEENNTVESRLLEETPVILDMNSNQTQLLDSIPENCVNCGYDGLKYIA